MRRPAPLSLADIKHPGPRSDLRRPHISCHAEERVIDLPGNDNLLEILGGWADLYGYCSAVLDLRGLFLNGFDYVMPDRAIDDRHAAWYSEIQSSSGAILDDGVAILGWKDGSRFAHIHASWQQNGRRYLGHLLPGTLRTDRSIRLKGFGLRGGRFIAEQDPETEFQLFRVKEDRRFRTKELPNAVITTLAPFEDLYNSVNDLGGIFNDKGYDVFGLGSLAGAEFKGTAPMKGLISETIICRDACRKTGETLRLPIQCVDLYGDLYSGDVKPGAAPTLVTCEILLVGRMATTGSS